MAFEDEWDMPGVGQSEGEDFNDVILPQAEPTAGSAISGECVWDAPPEEEFTCDLNDAIAEPSRVTAASSSTEPFTPPTGFKRRRIKCKSPATDVKKPTAPSRLSRDAVDIEKFQHLPAKEQKLIRGSFV